VGNGGGGRGGRMRGMLKRHWVEEGGGRGSFQLEGGQGLVCSLPPPLLALSL